jgi:hypothetical protein
MNSDCIIQKVPVSQCVNNQREYLFNVIKNASGTGKCNFIQEKDDLIGRPEKKILNITNGMKEKLFCEDDECIINSNIYKDAIKCILKELQNTFVKMFNEGIGNCVSDKTVKQNMTINIGPNADLGECEIDISQKINLQGKKVCIDINKSILRLKGEEKEKFLNQVLDFTFMIISSKSPYIQSRQQFIESCKDILFEKLMAIDDSINSKCSQSIYVGQDQNVYLLGTIKCKNSVFEFSQNAVVNAYMSCITEPFFDDIMNDISLKRLYEAPADVDCIYDKILIQPCNGTDRKFRINILRDKKGNGKCLFTNNQIISETCSLSKCKVSDWSPWSICAENKQERTRKVITPGDDCPHFKESRLCTNELRDSPNADQKIASRPPPILKETYGYEWFFYGPSYLSPKQKTIFTIFIIIVVIAWIYTVFIK